MPLTASTTDKFTKVGNPGSATTMSAPGYTAGGSSMNVGSTTNWPPDTKVVYAVDRAQVVNGVETRIAGTYSEFEGIVTGANTIANVKLRFGNAQNYPAGSLTRVYIPVSSTRENDLVEGFAVEHNLDGTHDDGFIVPRYLSAALKSGWFTVSDTWTFASYDASTKTGVVNVPNDATLTYFPGMRSKFSNNGSTQYGIIVAVTATTLTIYFGTDYSLTNLTISAIFYSVYKAPFGFPLDPAKWSLTTNFSSTTLVKTGALTSGTWYATTGGTPASIVVGPGVWRLSLQAGMKAQTAAAATLGATVALSTNLAAPSNPNATAMMFSATTLTNFHTPLRIETTAAVSSNTTFNGIFTPFVTQTYTELGFSNGNPTLITAECAYL